MRVFGSRLCMVNIGEVDELAASIMSDLMYWQSLDNIDSNGTKCSLIYKIMQRIRASDPNAYEPGVLSIGPYHYDSPSLLPMAKEKWLCLDYVLKLNCNRSLHDYLAVIASLERQVRVCYSEDSQMNSRTFVEMLLLDSCFILVCLNGIEGIKMQADVHKGYSQDQYSLKEVARQNDEPSENDIEMIAQRVPEPTCSVRGDFVLEMEQIESDTCQEIMTCNSMEPRFGQSQENIGQEEQWYNSSAVYDLLLLENQIPFFIVTKIFEVLVDYESTTYRLLTDNLAKFIEGVLLHMPSAIKGINRPKNFDHLLHLCYMYFKPSGRTQHKYQGKEKAGYFHNLLCWGIKFFFSKSESQEAEESILSSANFETAYHVKQLKRWRRAEEYHEAGVEFMEMVFDEHNPHSLLDIEFRNGTLHIPRLPIDDKFGTLFRNLIAFEQSCPELGNDLASYVYFISQLISAPDDVALLSRKGVIVHQLDNDEEVSTLFSKLFEYVVFDFYGEHYLKMLCHTMEAYYQNRVNRWMAWLRHKHFGNPWLGFTAFGSVVMILCSICQTILAFMSYMSTS